jgi:hypothetical protein
MKTLTDFALKDESTLFQPVGNKLDEIDFLIDWNFLYHF